MTRFLFFVIFISLSLNSFASGDKIVVRNPDREILRFSSKVTKVRVILKRKTAYFIDAVSYQ